MPVTSDAGFSEDETASEAHEHTTGSGEKDSNAQCPLQNWGKTASFQRETPWDGKA